MACLCCVFTVQHKVWKCMRILRPAQTAVVVGIWHTCGDIASTSLTSHRGGFGMVVVEPPRWRRVDRVHPCQFLVSPGIGTEHGVCLPSSRLGNVCEPHIFGYTLRQSTSAAVVRVMQAREWLCPLLLYCIPQTDDRFTEMSVTPFAGGLRPLIKALLRKNSAILCVRYQ